jgi:hypothetical protein
MTRREHAVRAAQWLVVLARDTGAVVDVSTIRATYHGVRVLDVDGTHATLDLDGYHTARVALVCVTGVR